MTLLPFIVLIGAMFLMTRSAKKKQQAAAQMRDDCSPAPAPDDRGHVRHRQEIQDDTVLLEVAPGVHAVYAKNAIGAVLDDAEYNRIVHGTTTSEDRPGQEGGRRAPKDTEVKGSEVKDAKADGEGDAK
ncbi:preprotein translocase subunit YajC [Streptomyces pratensis]|nr:preprotein translocase subunit YajC [Streptomyces pratensis]